MIKALILVIVLICFAILGYWLMGKLGRFFDNNRRKRWEEKW